MYIRQRKCSIIRVYLFQLLLREIEEYRSVLDRVNMKGRRLIDNNAKTPRLAEQMQAQLQNLEESYINLQATAEQIRVSTQLFRMFATYCYHIFRVMPSMLQNI